MNSSGPTISIAFACDENYSKYVAVVMQSIFARAAARDRHEFHILSLNLSAYAQTRLLEVATGGNAALYVHRLTKDRVAGFPVTDLPLETYLRLCLPDLLPEHDRIIYLDADLLVLDSLSALWNHALEGKAIGAAIDTLSVLKGNALDHFKALQLPDRHSYFNAGVLLLDLKMLRELKLLERARLWAAEHSALMTYNDQDVLNVLLAGRVSYLELRWNLQVPLIDLFKLGYRCSPEHVDAVAAPGIIHYVTSRKPWRSEFKLPYQSLYFKYLAAIVDRDEQGFFKTDDPSIDSRGQGYFQRREVPPASTVEPVIQYAPLRAGEPVSLAMTVYNRERYLSIALDSILTQTYPHWHLTIWDDGSTDPSAAIAREYAQLDPRIKFIPAPHTGRGNALRAALAASPHKYLAIIDSDDILAPNALAATVAILDRYPEVGMVYTDHWLIDEREHNLGLGARCQIPYSKERLLIDFMTFHFRLIRRDVYDKVGRIDLDFPQAEDYDLCLKISEVTEIYHLQQPLYYYRTHPDTSSVIQRDLQIECSATAVRNALVRRGLSDRYRLDVTEDNRFKIVCQG